jgi:hypothetical protein
VSGTCRTKDFVRAWECRELVGAKNLIGLLSRTLAARLRGRLRASIRRRRLQRVLRVHPEPGSKLCVVGRPSEHVAASDSRRHAVPRPGLRARLQSGFRYGGLGRNWHRYSRRCLSRRTRSLGGVNSYVRTYIVDPTGRRVGWFLSLDVTALRPTPAARAPCQLPYHCACPSPGGMSRTAVSGLSNRSDAGRRTRPAVASASRLDRPSTLDGSTGSTTSSAPDGLWGGLRWASGLGSGRPSGMNAAPVRRPPLG